MSEKTIILFPGQGAQHVGMGKAWAEKFDVARRTFEAADAALGFELSRTCFEGPEDAVTRTDVAQAAIYVTSVACCRALAEQGVIDFADVAATAGLSLGEYTALWAAEALSFEDGLQLVRQRGMFMQEAAMATPSGMVAVIGADPAEAGELCERARGGSAVLVPANFNCPGQVVVSGSTEACRRALDVAEEMGLRATALTVAGAFHSPIMQPAADRMAEALEAVAWSQPKFPVMSNVTGKPHDRDIASIKRRLVEQIIAPVRWADDVQWLIGNIGGRFIEPAPGKVNAGLMRRIDRKTRVQNHAEPV